MPENAYLLLSFDEATEVQCQEHCQSEIDRILCELRGLVLVSEMPDGSRDRLLDGLDHISHHIGAQTELLIADISGRVN